tara:strand:+ start:6771 stop:7028 length:258 start_codon:yes stop_codon:yes gene_type:complete
MSLLKSLTGLAKATVLLAKEDKDFRKETAKAVATLPIYIAKNTINVIDLATGATKNVETVLQKTTMKQFEMEARANGFDLKVDFV